MKRLFKFDGTIAINNVAIIFPINKNNPTTEEFINIFAEKLTLSNINNCALYSVNVKNIHDISSDIEKIMNKYNKKGLKK